MIVLSLSLLLGWSSPAHAAPVSEQAYDRAVDLVDRLYLHRQEVDAATLLRAAAEGLSDELDWLEVDADGHTVYLRHGDGTAIGSVSVANMATLPEALRSLEAVVRDSGYDTGGVDLRLEILKGMTTPLDRYSRVLAGDKLERFDVRLKGTLVGIGAELKAVDDRLVVSDVSKGGPAEQGGLRAGDVVTRIDGVSTVGLALHEATEKIRGDADTDVTLEVRRGEETLTLTLTRAEVVVQNVKSEVLADGVGYVAIDHFSQRTVDNLVEQLDELRSKGALSKGLVIDLRGNTGGSMKEAARSADQFVTDGLLLKTVGSDGGHVQNLQAQMLAVVDGTEPDVPIAILVDDRTASGSEILAGALLELDRAVLIGSRTYGKGTVQKIYNLDDDVRLKLTVAQYVLANDRKIADGGLVPDVSLGDVDFDEHGIRYRGWEESRSGVPWDEIIPVVYERGYGPADDDPARDVAVRAVLRAKGSTREDVLKALATVVPEVRDDQERRLVKAYEARHIDWSPAPGVPAGGLVAPKAVVHLSTSPDPADPDVIVVHADVENQGEEPLHRALVEVESPDFEPWTGLVVPIGLVKPGQTGSGEVRVTLDPGIEPREDVVHAKLRADAHAALALEDAVLRASSSPIPRVAVDAKLLPAGAHADGAGADGVRVAEITVRNLSTVTLSHVKVSVGYSGEATGIELLDAQGAIATLDPKQPGVVDVRVKIDPGAPAKVPLEVQIAGDRFDRLADWTIPVPADGSAVTLEAPRIQARQTALAAPAGAPYTVPIQVADDHGLDHVVVYVNGEKAAWAGGGRTRVDLKATIDVGTGFNRVLVLAEDDQGVSSRKLYVVRGEPQTAVDAGEADGGE